MKVVLILLAAITIAQRPTEPPVSSISRTSPVVSSTSTSSSSSEPTTSVTSSTAPTSTFTITFPTTELLSTARITASNTAVPTENQSADSGSKALVIGGIVFLVAIVLAVIGIFIFRKLNLAPSNGFKNRLKNDAPNEQLYGAGAVIGAALPERPLYATYETTVDYVQPVARPANFDSGAYASSGVYNGSQASYGINYPKTQDHYDYGQGYQNNPTQQYQYYDHHYQEGQYQETPEQDGFYNQSGELLSNTNIPPIVPPK